MQLLFHRRRMRWSWTSSGGGHAVIQSKALVIHVLLPEVSSVGDYTRLTVYYDL